MRLRGGTRRQRLELRADGSLLFSGDGACAAVFECLDVDLRVVHEADRQHAENAFARLTATLQVPWQVVVRRRRLLAAEVSGDDGSASSEGIGILDRALTAHRRRRLLERTVYDNRIYLVLSAPRMELGVHAVEEAAQLLQRALGPTVVQARRLEQAALRAFVAEGPTGALRESSGGVSSARRSYHAVMLTRFPGLTVVPGWMAPVLEVDCEADVSVRLQPVARSQALAMLRRRLRVLHADRLVALERQLDDGDASSAAAAGTALQSRLVQREVQAVAVGIVAVAHGPAPEAAASGATRLREALRSTMAEAGYASLRQLPALLSTHPASASISGLRLTSSDAAATCTPWTATRIDDPGGYRLGLSEPSGLPIRVDPFDTRHQANGNIAVLAASGHGKTYAVGMVLLEAAARGVQNVVVDPEDEYAPVMEAVGGRTLRLGAGGVGLDVFRLHHGLSDPTRRSETIASVAGLLEILQAHPLTPLQRAAIAEAAGSVIDADGAPSSSRLLDFARLLDRTDPDLSRVVREAVRVAPALFSPSIHLDIADGRSVALGFRDLQPALVDAATFLVAQWLWTVVRTKRQRRHIVFDETGLLSAHASLRTLLVQLARRCRKYDAGLVVATQNAGDLLRTEDGVVVVTNAATVLAGGHRGTESQRLAALFGLHERHRQEIERSHRGRFVLLAGARRDVIAVEGSPQHHEVLTRR